MRNSAVVCWLLVMSAAAGGCSKSESPGTKLAHGSKTGPGAAVAAFLTAISERNEDRIYEMLTDEARTGLKAKGISPQLPSSGSTSFQVGDVEQVDGGAHVMSDWYERSETGELDTTKVLWMLRQEKSNWRVAGMAIRVFDDRPAVILNFEDPDDMIRKLDLIAEEDERRAQETAPQTARSSDESPAR